MYHRLLSLKTIIFANKCKKQLLRIAGTICKSFQCSRPRRAEEIQRGGAHVFFLDILSLFALFERRLAFRALSRYFRTHFLATALFALSLTLMVCWVKVSPSLYSASAHITLRSNRVYGVLQYLSLTPFLSQHSDSAKVD